MALNGGLLSPSARGLPLRRSEEIGIALLIRNFAALISILATVGVEAVFLFIFAFIVVAIRAAKDLKEKKAEESAEAL